MQLGRVRATQASVGQLLLQPQLRLQQQRRRVGAVVRAAGRRSSGHSGRSTPNTGSSSAWQSGPPSSWSQSTGGERGDEDDAEPSRSTYSGNQHHPSSSSGGTEGRYSPQHQQYGSYNPSSGVSESASSSGSQGYGGSGYSRPPSSSGGGGGGAGAHPSSSTSSAPPVPGFLQSLPFSRDVGNRTPLGASLAARLRGTTTGAAGRGSGASTGGGSGGGSRGGGDKSSGWSFRPTEHADGSEVAPWVIAALAPVCVWAVTWALTSGLAHLADAGMGGMCGVARLLFPTLPVRGVVHEDVAVSLVKSMQAGTVDEATWCRAGLFVPSWLLQAFMRLFFVLAAGSTSIAASLTQGVLCVSVVGWVMGLSGWVMGSGCRTHFLPQPVVTTRPPPTPLHSQQHLTVGAWMTACGLSQAILCVLCLLIALPVGAGLHSLMQRVEGALGGTAAADDDKPTAPGRSGSPAVNISSSSSSTALALKLAATLAWPCISVTAVSAAITQRTMAAPPFGLALAQVVVSGTSVALLLTIALATARFAREVGLGTAGDAAAVDFGIQVGALCGAQAAVNALQLLVGWVGGVLAPREVVVALLSTAVLVRLAATIWVLQAEPRPSAWLQLLTLDTLLSRKPAPQQQ